MRTVRLRLATAAAALLVTAPLAGQAQTQITALELSGPGDANPVVVGRQECGTSQAVNWTATVVGVPCSDITLWATEGTCGDEPGASDVTYDSVPLSQWASAPTGSFTFTPNGLPGFQGAGASVACGADGVEKRHYVCGAFTYASFDCASGAKSTVRASRLEVLYDAVPPAAPTLEAPVALDSALSIRYVAAADVAETTFQARKAGEGEFVPVATAQGASGTVRLENLSNDVAYEVRAVAKDGAGNESEPSAVVTGTPIPTAGFYDAYIAAGGKDSGGGCTAAGGAMGTAAALLTGWMLSRRKRR